MSKTLKKQSILVAALTSSFGIFVSKALGLLYYSPLSALAGEENMVFYSITYTYYDLLLKISNAGIPFAIAALVARYYAKDDYKTVLLVKKLGVSLIMGISFIVSILFLLFSKPLALQSMGASASLSDVEHLSNLFLILVFAVILVPFLSAIRGYYQGLKRFDLYGFSQALEQFVRVFSILLLGYLFVKVFSFESIYAIYCAIAAAAIAAFITIIFFVFMTKEDDKHVSELIKQQETNPRDKSLIIKEMLSIGIPYILISFIGSLSPLVNTSFFIDTVTKTGVDISYAKLSMGILQANIAKLNSIPQVLTLGFSAGLVPYLVESLEKQDYQKLSDQISQIFDTVLYILLPVLIIFFFFAKDIYFIMYGNNNLQLSTSLFKASCLVTLTDSIAPILSSVMITLKLRKQAVFTLICSVLIKLVSFFPLVRSYGTYGMCYSTFLCSLFVIIVYVIVLNIKFDLRFFQTAKRFVFVIISSVLSILPIYLVNHYIPFEYTSRLLCIVKMGISGLFMVVNYYFVSSGLKLPQNIFNIKKLSPIALLRKFRGKQF